MLEGFPNLNELGRTALDPPGADRITFWDHSALVFAHLRAHTGLAISGTDLIVSNLTVAQFASQAISQWTNDAGYLTSESDPVFGASAAASISGGDISNWDTAFDWGDHASAGYLTSVADATTTTKGIASFATADFDVASGAVELKDSVVKTINTPSGVLTPSAHTITINATSSTGVQVSHSGATISIAGINASTSVKGVASFNSTNFTVSSGAVNTIQSIATAASPTFAGMTLSGTTASRLMATNGSKALTSVADLTAWVAGTTNQVSVANDGDGSITLSTPQNIHSDASPTFAGLTLTSFSGVVKAAAGVLSGSATTSDLPEGTNLYWTQSRFDTALAAASVVAQSLFNAHTILAATVDNTPAALTVDEQTLVGRITGGNIAALSASQARTLLNVADGATANAKATSGEVNTGTDDAKFITPLALNASNIGLLALSSLQLLDFQVFNSSGTWNKPTGARFVHAFPIGAGGGGGSGRKSGSGDCFGGEGGCPGGAVEGWFDADDLSSSEAVVVGAGGAGGAARTTTSNGAAGGNGGESTFAGAAAGGGRNGRGGTSTGPTSTPFTPALQNGGTSLQADPAIIYSGSGSVIPDPNGGHVGAGSHGDGNTTAGTSGGAAGAAGAGGLQGNPGGDGTSSSNNTLGGAGGGGGNGVGAAGGAGGDPGGGGGGGGYGDGSTNSGAGGAGGDGRVVVITWG